MVRFVMLVDLDGTIRAEIQDAPGEACLDHIDSIRRLAPNATVVESSVTSEFSHTVRSHRHATEGVQDHDA